MTKALDNAQTPAIGKARDRKIEEEKNVGAVRRAEDLMEQTVEKNDLHLPFHTSK
jgi:hypothetical protein